MQMLLIFGSKKKRQQKAAPARSKRRKKAISVSSGNVPVTVIRPRKGWTFADFKELKDYRDLFYFLIWRNVKVLYAQTVLGFSWAIIQPLMQIVIFTVIFGKVAKVPTDGIPYFLFSTVAIIPWTYMATSMTQSSQSLVTGQNMLGKIYFPRVIFPLTPILSNLISFGISLIILLAVMGYYRVMPTWNLVYLPLFMLLMMLIPAGIGMWLSALAIRYRDVKFAMQYIIQLLIYSAPILYSASSIPEEYRLYYSMNPIVTVIEGYRACLLGTPINWIYVALGVEIAIILFISGAIYFKRMERIFVDVI